MINMTKEEYGWATTPPDGFLARYLQGLQSKTADLKAAFSAAHGIPGKREPETGWIYDDPVARLKIAHLIHSRHDVTVDLKAARCDRLVSLAIDANNESDSPRSFDKLGIEARMRAGIHLEREYPVSQIEFSFKDTKKTSDRREWSARTFKVARDHLCIDQPLASRIPEEKLRVYGVCLYARFRSLFSHTVNRDTSVLYEMSVDECVFTRPDMVRILDRRCETEIEALKVRADTEEEANLNGIITHSLSELRKGIYQSARRGLKPAGISKVLQTREAVKRASKNGDSLAEAFALNMRPDDYKDEPMLSGLINLSACIPEPEELALWHQARETKNAWRWSLAHPRHGTPVLVN